MSKVNNKTKEQLIEELEILRQRVAELEGSEDKCERTGGGSRNDCQTLLDAQHDLRERIKELTCLHKVTRLVTKTGISLDKVFNNVVNIIKAAWQYPEIACVRLVFDGKEFKTDNFKLTEWKQSSDIKLNGETIGTIEVYYLEEKPELDEGPFLKEERAILEDVARELGNFVKRKQMDEEIKESEERYRALLELDAEVGEAVIMLQDTDKAEAVHTYVSDRWTQITGFSREELLGRSFFDFIHTKYLKASIERHRRKMAGENIPGLFELLIIRKDGTEVPIELTSAYTTYKGKRANVAYIRDITERKQTEEKHKAIIETTVDGFWISNLEGRLLEVNDAYCKITGYTREELFEMSIWDIEALESPEDVIRHIQQLRKQGYTSFESKHKCKDGKIIDVEVSSNYLDMGEGTIFSFIRDITERKLVEQKLKEYSEHLEEQVEKRTAELQEQIRKRIDYTRALVHELKTPLTPLVAASDFLASKLQEEPLLSFAKNINAGAINLSNRIEELLDLAKGEMGTLELIYKPVDFQQLLKDTIDYMTPETLRNKQSLVLDMPAYLPMVCIDKERIQQVLLNLLDNASKFTRKGGSTTLKARENDTGIIIEVKDNGCGIDKEEMEHLFEPYYRRLQNSRAHLSGLGLGLTLSKMIIELHGGKIWVTSLKSKGSRFSFWLPLEPTGKEKSKT